MNLTVTMNWTDLAILWWISNKNLYLNENVRCFEQLQLNLTEQIEEITVSTLIILHIEVFYVE